MKNFDDIGCKLQTAVICRERSDNNDDGDVHEDHDGDRDVDDRVQSANGGYLRRKVRCSSRVSQKLIPHPLSCLTWGQLSRIQIQIQIQKDTNTNNNIISIKNSNTNTR